MTRHIVCRAVAPEISRRSVLLGLVGAAALAPAAVARPTPGPVLGDLVAGDGTASSLARSLAGTTVSLRGYLAPSLDGREFPMTEASAALCQLCGNLHDGGANILVRADGADVPVLQRVEVTGRLEVGEAAAPGVRLTATGIRTI